MSDSGNIVDFWYQFGGRLQRRARRSLPVPAQVEGVIAAWTIVQRPANGVLRQLNKSTFAYTANPGYTGPDTFSVQVTGKGRTASGTSIITLVATVR